MRKLVLIVVSALILLAFTPAVYAEVQTLIGRKVQAEFPVTVNGSELGVRAIVIDGTSYLPVRAMGEALDMEIKFNAELGIEVYEKEASRVVESREQTIPSSQEMSDEDKETIQRSEEQIATLNSRIADNNAKIADIDAEIRDLRKEIDSLPDGEDSTYYTERIKVLEANKQGLVESNAESATAIEQLQEYIQKIRDKYTGG